MTIYQPLQSSTALTVGRAIILTRWWPRWGDDVFTSTTLRYPRLWVAEMPANKQSYSHDVRWTTRVSPSDLLPDENLASSAPCQWQFLGGRRGDLSCRPTSLRFVSLCWRRTCLKRRHLSSVGRWCVQRSAAAAAATSTAMTVDFMAVIYYLIDVVTYHGTKKTSMELLNCRSRQRERLHYYYYYYYYY